MKNYERFIFVAFIVITILVEAAIVSAPTDVSTSESEIASSSVNQELNSQEEASEKRKENFEKVLKEAGLKEDYDWYIENDLEEYIEGQWDGDEKKTIFIALDIFMAECILFVDRGLDRMDCLM